MDTVSDMYDMSTGIRYGYMGQNGVSVHPRWKCNFKYEHISSHEQLTTNFHECLIVYT